MAPRGLALPKTHAITYIWQHADYEGISSYLSQVDWQSTVSHNLTRDSLWSSFCDILQTTLDLYVPTGPAGSHTSCSFIAKKFFLIFDVHKDYMTLNRATLNQRQLIGRQLTAATFNRYDN